MINYNDGDLTSLEGWETILNHYNIPTIDDDEVWELARLSKEQPIFENILLSLTADRIRDLCDDMGIECTSYINCMDSHIWIGDDEIYDNDDFLSIVEPA